MRKEKSLKNLIISLGLGVISIAVSFVAQKIFINTLGLEYAGVNILFTSIISILSIAELGIGSAIIYHLYKPLHEKQWSRIGQLMGFYRKGYRLIALIIFLIGLAAMPWVGVLTDANITPALSVIFFVFILDASVSYLLSYKRSLLYADQHNYIINIVRIASMVALNCTQIAILVTTQNYLLFVILKLIATITENVVISMIVDKRYSHVDMSGKSNPLDTETRKDIFKKIHGLLYHRLATFAVNGTDTLIISVFLGATVAGLYSNYYIVIAAINSLFSQLSTAITASVGNLLVEKDSVYSGVVFNRLQFAYFVIGSLTVAVFINTVNPFVEWWLGDRYVLDFSVISALGLSLYMTVMRPAFHSFKTAAGIFYEDRFVAVTEAVVNLIASLLLLQLLGLAGVFIGTAISSLVLHLYSYPKFVYIGILKRSYRSYISDFVKKMVLATVAVSLSYWIIDRINIESGGLQIATNAVVAASVTLVVLLIFYKNSEEFLYYRRLLKIKYRRIK